MENIRLILCKDCLNWSQSPNVELGTCRIVQDEEIVENTTYYNSRCLYGLFEKINVSSIALKEKDNKPENLRNMLSTQCENNAALTKLVNDLREDLERQKKDIKPIPSSGVYSTSGKIKFEPIQPEVKEEPIIIKQFFLVTYKDIVLRQLMQLQTFKHDKDLLSIEARDALVDCGYISSSQEWNYLTGDGFRVLYNLKLLGT